MEVHNNYNILDSHYESLRYTAGWVKSVAFLRHLHIALLFCTSIRSWLCVAYVHACESWSAAACISSF